MGNGLSISEMLLYVGNDLEMWEMAKICGKWRKYLKIGLNMWEMS